MKTILYVAASVMQDDRRVMCSIIEDLPPGTTLAPMSAIEKCVKRLAFAHSVSDRAVQVMFWSVAVEDRKSPPLCIFGD